MLPNEHSTKLKHTHKNKLKHTCTYAHKTKYTHKKQTCTHTHPHIYIHINTQGHKNTHSRRYTRTHTHTHTHTQTKTHSHIYSNSSIMNERLFRFAHIKIFLFNHFCINEMVRCKFYLQYMYAARMSRLRQKHRLIVLVKSWLFYIWPRHVCMHTLSF